MPQFPLLFMTLALFSAATLAPAQEGEVPARNGDRQSLPVLDLAFIEQPGTQNQREIIAMRVLEDGQVLLPNERTGRMEVVSRMSLEELQNLRSELLQDHQLDELKSERLQEEIITRCQQRGLEAEIAGAAATVIRLRDGGTIHVVSCPAVSIAAARFPDSGEIQRLFTTQLRLQNVAAIARAGGLEASVELARQANQLLEQTHPLADPLDVRDLAMVRKLPTGCRYVQFYRQPTSVKGGDLAATATTEDKEGVMVSVISDPGQAPRVSVMFESAVVR